MKRILFIAMAALTLLFTQCKKDSVKPTTLSGVMVPISANVSFGGEKATIDVNGVITPEAGDVIYIYWDQKDAGYVTCSPTSGSSFNWNGEIDESALNEKCVFVYAGKGNTSTTTSYPSEVSFETQAGTIDKINQHLVGSCIATAKSGTTLNMKAQMAIAWFNLNTAGGGGGGVKKVTISGAIKEATINKIDGTISGTVGDITVERFGYIYVALVPQGSPTNTVTLTFKEEKTNKTGTYEFINGIQANCFYKRGGTDAIPVTLN